MSGLGKNVIVIGAGIAGMASAIRLAAKGYKVIIFESSNFAGGKLHEFYLNQYRFDAGPSLFTMPHLVTDLLALAGIKKDDFPYIQLEEACHYFFSDGVQLTAYADPKRFALEIQEKLNANPNVVLSYLDRAKKNYEATAPLFIESSLHKINTYLSVKTLKGLLALPKLHMFSSMNQRNKAELKEPHLVQFFNRYATYNGSNPFKAPATLNMIPHLEHGIGTFFPHNGMNQISEKIKWAAEKMGVEFVFNTSVSEIVVENNSAKGVKVGDRLFAADYVISNMDVYPTYKKLLSSQKAPEKLLNQEKSSSAIIFYWGIKKVFPQLDLHNIFFSEDYEREFDSIFEGKDVYDDPTIYINISSKYKATDAPTGCENWFVMINVPPNNSQDWNVLVAKAKLNILAKLSKILKHDIAELIEEESILDPRTIESKTSSYKGSLYGNASNNRYAAFLRHANFSHKIKNLFFCGGSVHPGGGIPLCLNSGKIVSELIHPH